MEYLKKINEIKGAVDKLLACKERDLEALEVKRDEVEEKITVCKADMEKASIHLNMADFKRAKSTLRDLEDEKEMYNNRMTALEDKPLMLKADYDRNVAEIYSEMAALESETKKTLARLSDEMHQAAEELRGAQEYANEVLALLQHDVYRDQDRSRNNKGEVANFPNETKEIDKWEVIRWGDAGIKNYQYQLYTGIKTK